MSDEDLRRIERAARYDAGLARLLECLRDGHVPLNECPPFSVERPGSFGGSFFVREVDHLGRNKTARLRGCSRCGGSYVEIGESSGVEIRPLEIRPLEEFRVETPIYLTSMLDGVLTRPVRCVCGHSMENHGPERRDGTDWVDGPCIPGVCPCLSYVADATCSCGHRRSVHVEQHVDREPVVQCMGAGTITDGLEGDGAIHPTCSCSGFTDETTDR